MKPDTDDPKIRFGIIRKPTFHGSNMYEGVAKECPLRKRPLKLMLVLQEKKEGDKFHD
jgi:hypothetical protein